MGFCAKGLVDVAKKDWKQPLPEPPMEMRHMHLAAVDLSSDRREEACVRLPGR